MVLMKKGKKAQLRKQAEREAAEALQRKAEEREAAKNEARHEKNRKKRRGRETKGAVVYLGHIPHGFYEGEIKTYCRQYGDVQEVMVSRSSSTGRSRGWAWVRFKETEVAEKAAADMNNAVMGSRVLKSHVVDPGEVRSNRFPTAVGLARAKLDKEVRVAGKLKSIDDLQPTRSREQPNVKLAAQRLRKHQRLEEKLKAAGVDYFPMQAVGSCLAEGLEKSKESRKKWLVKVGAVKKEQRAQSKADLVAVSREIMAEAQAAKAKKAVPSAGKKKAPKEKAEKPAVGGRVKVKTSRRSEADLEVEAEARQRAEAVAKTGDQGRTQPQTQELQKELFSSGKPVAKKEKGKPKEGKGKGKGRKIAKPVGKSHK